MNGMFFVVLGTLLSLSPASPASPSPEVTAATSLEAPGTSDETAPPSASSSSRDHWIRDSNDTRLLLGPTARSLKRGEAYIDDVSVFFPSIQVGLSDRVSIGAGTPVMLPPIDIRPGDAVWVTPKAQVFSGHKTQAAIGLVHTVVLGHHAGLAYGVTTYGTSDAAVTLGLGLAYPNVERQRPVALLGAEKRVSPRLKLITENYLGSFYGDAFLSAGMRYIHRRRTLDVSWSIVPGLTVYPLPLVRFSFQVSGPDR